jgi:hypothetical protein
MKLLNSTSEDIVTGYDGTRYCFKPYQMMSFSELTGRWLLEHEEFKGLVDITYNGKAKDYQSFIAMKMLQGKEAYVVHKNNVIDQFMVLDTELKNNNQFGTVLNRKEVRDVVKCIENTTKEIKEIEAKFGISIEKSDFEKKSQDMFAAIDATVAAYESDNDEKQKFKKQQAEQDSLLNSILKEMPVSA